MRRKLISYEAFDRIEKNSLSNAAYELAEAEHLLSNLLETDSLSLHCYDQSNVVYKQHDGTYVRADYAIKEGRISFSNIEQVVIDEETFGESVKSTLGDMLEALLNDDEAKAATCFHKYMEVAAPKMRFAKGRKNKDAMDKMACNIRGNMKEDVDPEVADREKIDTEKSRAAKMGHFRNPASKLKAKATRSKNKHKIDQAHESPAWKKAKDEVSNAKKLGKKNARIKPQRYEEWLNVAENVLDYIDVQVLGPAIHESQVERNHHGEVVAVTVPTTKVRAEGKILNYKYQGLKTDVKVLREEAFGLSEDVNFQRAVANVKKFNNISDNNALEEALNALVGQFPSVLYLTQEELAKTISDALENAGVGNYDDQRCSFMAEGILRVAFEAYPERVARIASLANANLPEVDAFETFQNVVTNFYSQVDEATAINGKVFGDLLETFADIRREAIDLGMDGVRNDAARYMEMLEAVVEGYVKPNLDLAEQAAAYIVTLIETNLESSAWDVVKKPYTTMVGEHPDMSKKAGHSYTPSRDFSGNWGDSAPALDDDGRSYKSGGAKKMRNNSWGNKGGKDTYPDLRNPIVPKAGDFTMKGEKGVDKGTDDALGQWQSNDTFPGISNPYLPKSSKTHVNSDNRVDDVEAKM